MLRFILSFSPRTRLVLLGLGLALVVLGLVLGLKGGDGEETQVVRATPQASATATVEAVSAGLLEEEEEPASALTQEDLEGRGDAGESAPTGGPAPNGSLVISRIGINAPLTPRVVGGDGVMQNPNGPEDVAVYDFSAIPGLGGRPGVGGNTILSGHVDYHNYGPAVFWRLRDLQPGDEIELRLADGSTFKYAVQWNRTVDASSADWNNIVAATSEESVTLITCAGNFDSASRSYDQRRVVWAVRI